MCLWFEQTFAVATLVETEGSMSETDPFLYAHHYGAREDHFRLIEGDDEARLSIVSDEVFIDTDMTVGEHNEATLALRERAIQNGMEFIVACEADVVDVTRRMAYHIMDNEFDEKVAAVREGREYVPPAFVSLMNGANPWMATLGRELNKLGYEHYLGPFEPVSINLSRFGKSQTGSLEVEVKKHLTEEDAEAIAGRRLILLDDLVDEGYTLEATKVYLNQRMRQLGHEVPPDMQTAVLGSKNIELVTPDYVGMKLPVVWVAGWGCDSQGYFRYCDLIGVTSYQDPAKKEHMEELIERRRRREAGDPDVQPAPAGSLINVDFTLVDSDGNVLSAA